MCWSLIPSDFNIKAHHCDSDSPSLALSLTQAFNSYRTVLNSEFSLLGCLFCSLMSGKFYLYATWRWKYEKKKPLFLFLINHYSTSSGSCPLTPNHAPGAVAKYEPRTHCRDLQLCVCFILLLLFRWRFRCFGMLTSARHVTAVTWATCCYSHGAEPVSTSAYLTSLTRPNPYSLRFRKQLDEKKPPRSHCAAEHYTLKISGTFITAFFFYVI